MPQGHATTLSCFGPSAPPVVSGVNAGPRHPSGLVPQASEPLENLNVRRVRPFLLHSGHLENPGQVTKLRVLKHPLERIFPDVPKADVLMTIDARAERVL